MTKEFKLILATSNKDKAREIAEILSDTPFVVTTMKEEGYDPDIVEDGKTFEENALIKARTVHALAEGLPLWLGGIQIESPFGCIAHSDGDVAIHALCDAILGALALGDIGKHFPDTDPAFAGADSLMRALGMN